MQVETDFLAGKRALVRVDFNVPQHEDLSVSDDTRIRAALPTITYLSRAGAKVILTSHLGRPKGVTEKYSLKPVFAWLTAHYASITGNSAARISFAADCLGDSAVNAVAQLRPGDICLLENVRFHPEEEKNDPEFAKQLASLADLYVNDAFGTAHRAHASTQGVSKYLKPSLAGLLLDREVRVLGETLNNPQRPFATVIGGAKVSSKIGVLENLLSKVDVLVIGGAMAFSFLKARGLNVGKSLVEDDKLEFCRKLEEQAKAKKVKIVLPVDSVCATEMKADAKAQTFDADKIPSDMMGLDIGPKTEKLVTEALNSCKTILWNGPMGVFEMKPFQSGTWTLIDCLVKLTAGGAKTVLGGGDSVAAIGLKGVSEDKFTHVSTGGGASLEFIEGLELPGVACLDNADSIASATAR